MNGVLVVIMVIVCVLTGGILYKGAIQDELNRCEQHNISIDTCVKIYGLKR